MRNFVLNLMLLSAGLLAAAPCAAQEAIPLAGTWRFRLDPHGSGVQERWFASRLPKEIDLPGSTDEAKLGLPNPHKPSLDGLYRPNVYAGPAWYQRDVEIPDGWRGKRVLLSLERVHWETQVWLDGRKIGGVEDSLISPQVHDLGADVAPGKHTLTLCVDNRLKFDLGFFVSINDEGTQTNWNGLIGRLELRAVDPVSIEDVQVYPDLDHKSAKVQVTIANVTGKPRQGTISLRVTTRPDGRTVAEKGIRYSAAEPRTVVSAELPLGDDVRPWDEFSPNLYELRASLGDKQQETPPPAARTVTFGMRKLEIRGTQFVLNGRPILLRGTLECAIFPATGYPPTDVPSWQRIFRVIKSYGLNFMRFHSWCPPEAAFAAADLEGVYLQPEGPEANIHIDRRAPMGQFMEQELRRMVRSYGNHPSFCLMTLGNEHNGAGDTLAYWVDMLIREDPRHFYCSASAGQMTPNRQYTEGGPRGIHGPGTDTDFRDAVVREGRPLMGHEIGQWTFFPNFDEIPKYRGVLEAKNFELIRDDLTRKHLVDLAPQFVQATGKQAVLLYKEEIEVLLRTPGYPGFSLLDLHDYPGQGTALIGLLDPFWDSKGFITPEDHSRYCGPTVPLLRMKKRIFTLDETFSAEAEISHFGPQDLRGARPVWSIKDQQGGVVASGTLPTRDVATGKLSPLGRIEVPLAKAAAPAKLTVSVALADTPFANVWEIWVYPAASRLAGNIGSSGIGPKPVGSALRGVPEAGKGPFGVPRNATEGRPRNATEGAAYSDAATGDRSHDPGHLVVSRRWDEATKSALGEGKRVLLFITGLTSQSLPGRFLPVFWSPVWFPTQKPNTMGILCDPKHPALAGFPTEFYSNWQWHDLLNHSRTMILDDTPPEFRPIVEVIDNFARNHKLGVLFETRAGKGRLLVCGIDLPGLADKQPAARQLLDSLYAYAGSEDFHPAQEIPAETLEKLLAPAIGTLMQKLGARVVRADSEAADYEARNVLDGDPATCWHTPWDDGAKGFPHELVIGLARPVSIRGVKLLPRQDMPNGRIKGYQIYVSLDGQQWGEPAAEGEFSRGADLQTVRFGRAVESRFLKFVARSSFEDKPYASLAELEVIPGE
jgi:hypothetical protein